MNFRTTISLLVLLVVAATVYFVTAGRDDGKKGAGTAKTDDAERKLLTLSTGDVKRVVLNASATGERIAFERTSGGSTGTNEWRITEPVQAPADAFKVDDLIREVVDLRSRGRVEPGEKGLDKPRFTVELTHGDDNKTTTVNVGNRSPVGDVLYVRLGNEGQADVVSASVVEQLEKPVSDYRKTRLLNVRNDEITAVTLDQGGKTLRLERSADDKWQILEPSKMPGDEGQVSALLSAVTGLNAAKFESESAKDAARYGLAKPTMTVTFATEPPATQPTTGPAATAAATKPAAGPTTTIKFGQADVYKKNVFAMVSDAGPIVTVPVTSVDALKKTPLDLRDREVLEINPDAVSRVTVSIDRAATTQPTSQPAEQKEIVLERRSESQEAGPAAPATGEAPAPAGDEAPPAPAPAKPDADAPAPAPAPEAPAEPQSRVTTPDGGAVVTLAAFQDAPVQAKEETSKADAPADAPAVPEADGDSSAKDKSDAPAAEAVAAPAAPAEGAAPSAEGAAPAATEPTTSTAPSTAPAAATQPAVPPSKWLLASEPKGDANDAHVQSLLGALRPLRALKFLESFPTTQATPLATYVVKVSTRSWADEPGREHELKITDPGGEANPIAQLGDLVFEVDRNLIDKLTADFGAPNTNPADEDMGPPPGFPGGGFPGGFPGGSPGGPPQ